jgi:hypothetical protein
MNTKDVVKAYNNTSRETAIRTLANQMVEEWVDLGMFRSCLNCEHWNSEDSKVKPPETCAKFGDARPPARIIVTGCPDHSDNIPF